MRNQFPFHFKRTDKEVKEIWKNPIFSFDANILLHLYRYSPDTRIELIEIIDKISPNLWLPEQAAYEYLKNRPIVISEQIVSLEVARKEVCDSKSKLTDQLKNKNTRSHPYYSEQAKQSYEVGTRALLDELDKNLTEIKALYNDDPTKDKIADWFDGRTGEAFSDEEFEEHCQAGEERYSHKVPPGYADGENKTKKDTRSEKRSRYGDFLIWLQLMNYAKSEKKDVIFVTDDAKEDWWLLKGDSEIFTPRPELIEEFYNVTGQQVLIYSFLKFLKHGRTHLNFSVSSDAEDETKAFSLDHIAKSTATRLNSRRLRTNRIHELARIRKKQLRIFPEMDIEIGEPDKGSEVYGSYEEKLYNVRDEIDSLVEKLNTDKVNYEILQDIASAFDGKNSEKWVQERSNVISEIKTAQNAISQLRELELDLVRLIDGKEGDI